MKKMEGLNKRTLTLTRDIIPAGSDALILPQALSTQFVKFLQYHPAKRVNRNLRRLLLEFLQNKSAAESIHLNEMLFDLEGLFNLLEVAEDEWKAVHE